jgi:hypothetical protein
MKLRLSAAIPALPQYAFMASTGNSSLFYTTFLAYVEDINKSNRTTKFVSRCKAVPMHAMKLCGTVEIWLCTFLTAEGDGLSGQIHTSEQRMCGPQCQAGCASEPGWTLW